MNPAMPFVPENLLRQLASIKPYLLLIHKKGENYEQPETKMKIQSEHLPFLFSLREKGLVDLSFPVMDATDVVAIAIINSTDKAQVTSLMNEDPCVKAGIFTFELFNGMGLKGDTLK